MPTWAVWCPRGDQCSRGGKVLARGANVDDLRQRLHQHLTAAPGHSELGPEEVDELARSTEVFRWDAEDEPAKAGLPIGAKRRRRADAWEWPTDDSGAGGSGGDGGEGADASGERLSDNTLSDISAAVALGIQEGVATALHPLQAASTLSPLAVSTPPAAGGNVLLPTAVVANLLDQLIRAEQASRQAARISMTAGNAFETEANHIAASRLHIDALLARHRL